MEPLQALYIVIAVLVVGAFAGDFIRAHRAGAALARRVYGVPLPGQAEIVSKILAAEEVPS